jgi:cystathionine beta-lyase/cystathionine gamma-synthase
VFLPSFYFYFLLEYIGGHSDLVAGAIVSRTKEQWERLDRSLRLLGGVLSPHDAFLIERGLKTLPLRSFQLFYIY